MDSLTGVYSALYHLPIWATALILYVVTLGVINELRDQLEGIPYQVARSAQYGDAGLMIAILIATTIIQRDGDNTLGMWSGGVQVYAVCVSGILGSFAWIATHKARSAEFGDLYHDLVVAPMILFMAVMLLPVIWYNGTKVELVSTLFLILFWLFMVVLDIKDDRMNQRRWLYHKGVIFK